MAEAYREAALRHWSDAAFLHEAKRYPNADQLVGIAAECAIKVALSDLPGCATGGALSKYYCEHVDILWERSALWGVNKRFPGLLTLLKSSKPFADWSIKHRYEPDSATDAARVQRHMDAAKRVLGAVSLLGMRRRS